MCWGCPPTRRCSESMEPSWFTIIGCSVIVQRMHLLRGSSPDLPVPLPRNAKQRTSDVAADELSLSDTSAVVSAEEHGAPQASIITVSTFRHAACLAGYRAVIFGHDSEVSIIARLPIIDPMFGFGRVWV